MKPLEDKPLKEYVRSIPDFPKPGVIFRDITTLIENGPAFRRTIDELAAAVLRDPLAQALPELAAVPAAPPDQPLRTWGDPASW